MVEIDVEQFEQAKGAWLSLDQCHGVDGEGVLEFRHLVKTFQDGLRVETILDLDDETGAVLEIGEVLDVGDASQFLGLDQCLDLGNDLLRAHGVWKLGDDDSLTTRADLLDRCPCSDPECSPTGGVSALHPVQSDD